MFFKVVYLPVMSTILQDTRLANLFQIWLKGPRIIQKSIIMTTYVIMS